MAQTPRDRLEHECQTVKDRFDSGEITRETRGRLLEFADALDPEITRYHYLVDGSEQTYALRSIERWVQCLRLCTDRGLDLVNATAEDVNEFIDWLHDERGIAKTTLSTGYQMATVHFYRYHDDLGVSPEDIHKYNAKSAPRHDEQDMFTQAEVDALRDACEHPRDRAFVELLIYSGQRITALRTLRIRDIDLDAGVFYLNSDGEWHSDGLKGAAKRGRKRPLFGARKYVRDWMQYHPNGDDGDSPLFIGQPNHWATKIDEPWSEAGVRHQLNRIADRAGVDKPVNPHNFRHYWVTVMKREYSMDEDTMRALLGLSKNSTVLQDTYSHVTNADYVEKAEQQLGYRETDDDRTLTPDACVTCGELLEGHWRRCPACGELYAPELQNAESELAEATDRSLDAIIDPDADLGDAERRALRELIDASGDLLTLVDTVE